MTYGFPRLDGELWFVKRLKDHGQTVFTGTTDPDTRRERIRQAILAGNLDCTILGTNAAGKPETYAQAFERFYNVKLGARS
jgi:hypothetical protein